MSYLLSQPSKIGSLAGHAINQGVRIVKTNELVIHS